MIFVLDAKGVIRYKFQGYVDKELDDAVDLRVEGRPRSLTTGVDLAAYRVVQEALTNTIKDAGASYMETVRRIRLVRSGEIFWS